VAERFDGVLETYRTGVVIPVPLDVKAVFGSGRPAVRATIGTFTFRTTLAAMGRRHLLGLNRQVREAAGVAVGDRVVVELELDAEPRTVELPAELSAVLDAEPELRAFFDGLSYTHRREYAEWIAGRKRDETRRRRVEQAADLLRRRVRHP
jgi:Bacteriocin-protection, YdeI or OmpD-Associated/Domain of unknown function (DUF1905)